MIAKHLLHGGMIGAMYTCLFFTLGVTALLRFGLVTLATSFFVLGLLEGLPITTDFSAWYAGSSLSGLFAVLTLAGFAFHTSLAGQSVFHSKLLED